MMDAGCYCMHVVRSLVGAQPEVLAARAQMVPGSEVRAHAHALVRVQAWGYRGPGAEARTVNDGGALRCAGSGCEGPCAHAHA